MRRRKRSPTYERCSPTSPRVKNRQCCSGSRLGAYVAAAVAALEPSLAGVIVGVPVVDISDLMRTHAPSRFLHHPLFADFCTIAASSSRASPPRWGCPPRRRARRHARSGQDAPTVSFDQPKCNGSSHTGATRMCAGMQAGTWASSRRVPSTATSPTPSSAPASAKTMRAGWPQSCESNREAQVAPASLSAAAAGGGPRAPSTCTRKFLASSREASSGSRWSSLAPPCLPGTRPRGLLRFWLARLLAVQRAIVPASRALMWPVVASQRIDSASVVSTGRQLRSRATRVASSS